MDLPPAQKAPDKSWQRCSEKKTRGAVAALPQRAVLSSPRADISARTKPKPQAQDGAASRPLVPLKTNKAAELPSVDHPLPNLCVAKRSICSLLARRRCPLATGVPGFAHSLP